jgi:hypothetical protein
MAQLRIFSEAMRKRRLAGVFAARQHKQWGGYQPVEKVDRGIVGGDSCRRFSGLSGRYRQQESPPTIAGSRQFIVLRRLTARWKSRTLGWQYNYHPNNLARMTFSTGC